MSHAGSNIGDNLLAEVLLRETAGRFPEAALHSFSLNPSRSRTHVARTLYPGSFSGLKQVISFLSTCRSADLLIGFWAVQDLGSLRFALKNLLPRYIFFAVFPRLFRVPLAFVNVDAAELHTGLGRAIAKLGLRSASVVVCRNATSTRTLAGLGVSVDATTCDIGLLYRSPQLEDRSATPGAAQLLINLRPVRSTEHAVERITSLLAPLIDKIGAERACFVALCDEDMEAYAAFARNPATSGVRVQRPKTVDEASRIFADARYAVTMRLHAQILAMLAGCTVFTIAYHAKNVDIANRVGLQHYCAWFEKDAHLEPRLQGFCQAAMNGSRERADLRAAVHDAQQTFTLLEQRFGGPLCTRSA